MPMNLPYLQYLRKIGTTLPSDFGEKLYATLNGVRMQANTLEQQTNSNMNGDPAPPPPVSQIRVMAGNGIFHVSVDHPGEFYRDIHYHAEYATDAAFTNPFPLPMQGAREWRGNLGKLQLHFRVSTSYGSSPAGQWAYANGPADGTGTVDPPLPKQSQGSGTGFPGQGLQGPGQIAFRSSTGIPPTRGAS